MIIYFMIESLLGGVKEDFQVEISLCNVILDWQQTQQSQCGSENSRSYDWYVNEKVAIDRDLATGWCLSSALADTFLKQVKICCETLQMRQGKCPRKVICLSKKKPWFRRALYYANVWLGGMDLPGESASQVALLEASEGSPLFAWRQPRMLINGVYWSQKI